MGQVVPGVPPLDEHPCWAADTSDDGTPSMVHRSADAMSHDTATSEPPSMLPPLLDPVPLLLPPLLEPELDPEPQWASQVPAPPPLPLLEQANEAALSATAANRFTTVVCIVTQRSATTRSPGSSDRDFDA